MQKQNDSIWSYTTPKLEPEMYLYSLTVDGVRTIDPGNAHAIRDVANISNVFIVPGERSELYMVQNVPHGTVAYRWYDSPTVEKTEIFLSCKTFSIFELSMTLSISRFFSLFLSSSNNSGFTIPSI